MELFRGYVPTRNKQCLEKFKGVEKLKTRSEVQDLDEYAGILGEETILIDVDDAETSELYTNHLAPSHEHPLFHWRTELLCFG